MGKFFLGLGILGSNFGGFFLLLFVRVRVDGWMGVMGLVGMGTGCFGSGCELGWIFLNVV